MSFLSMALLGAMHLAAPTAAAAPEIQYERLRYEDADFDVVRLNAADLSLHWKSEAGTPYQDFHALRDALAARKQTLLFAINAGIYARDFTPLGLHIENGKTLEPLNVKSGGGNFFLQPNGVFCIASGEARVLETNTFDKSKLTPTLAVQSGPMLVIEGEIHPKFRRESDSLYVRDGVGVNAAGETVFALSRRAINFHHFARFFRDVLGCSNALYLDGALSSMYYPPAGRSGPGIRYVGILALAVPSAEAP